MSTLDVEQLLHEVSAEEPCGPNLEYDPAFQEMEQASKPKDPGEFSDAPPEPPDWREVQTKALDLLNRSKDLRTGVYLAKALVHTSGLEGLADSLALLHGFVEKFWDSVHPQLDPDDNDPIMRVNALASLTDQGSMLRGLREAPLVRARALGQFCLRDVEIASGKAQPPADMESPPEMATIEGAFLESDLEELQGTAAAANRALEELQAMGTLLTERLGADVSPDLTALQKLLVEARAVLAEQLSRRGVGDAEAAAEGVAAEAAAGAGAAAPQAPPGTINSREDVIRVLDKICDYFNRQEPSSPIPLLLQRAKRLVSKDFMEILRDLTPDGVPQAEHISGLQKDTADGEGS